ncbi:tryptophan synthase subunit alpha [Nesterenkonia flava]|uniref:Tryptophan synthase alpha chain n=1 Tax=Nesterenkonia flava TaxID=469799 RepID=A0ABU1FVI0_9MICC|nr:tryptophan synthase subunit alpha [Nesterenkonia flava]MDR5712674.1 tryptophan synthase subunit alpha [Nesterenkonia flava]
MSKAAAAIDAAKAEGRSAFVGYLPAGYPDKETSIAAAIELVRGGADVIEIGIPYSDPVMDGPVIQQATTEVLARGFRISEVFEIVRAVTEATDAAVLVMTYYNLIDRMGAEEFARRLAEAGGAGAITPDLIPDEAADWIAATEKYGLDRVFLSAPTSTPERVARIAELSRGFVYGVSLMGVTGARDAVSDAAEKVVTAAKEAGAERVCVGLGVSTRAHVEEIGAYADGVIVGTALVAALRDGGPEAVGALAAELSGRA